MPTVKSIEGKKYVVFDGGIFFGVSGDRIGFFRNGDELESDGSVDKSASPEALALLIQGMVSMTDREAIGIVMEFKRE
ncbi:hypothetical protein KBD71_03565 [Candidatus Woesebacteria bacterium]|nr:hypothetical protein [Candidatus Woesebacteria bacterium]